MLAEQPQGHVTTPIMPALPFCYGSNTWKPDLVPSPHLPCDCCLLDSATCLIIHREYTRELDGDCLRAILRVYARENHELRERVEALEWLREVESLERDKEWWIARYVRIGQRPYDRLISENIDTVAHASKEAGV